MRKSEDGSTPMAFLHRLASGLKEGLTSLANVNEAPRKLDSQSRGLHKQTSRGKKSSSASLGYLEEHARDAIASFVQDKFDKGECKPHVFTQFWLQFPKLEAGFQVLRRQLEQRTGSREGPLPLALLQAAPQDFGLDGSSTVMQELCSKGAAQKCAEIDFVGVVMLLLVVHLTEPSGPLHEDVRTMLSCLELAFTHFNSARRGKLDKREVAEALQYEAAKAHTREGRSGRTSNRLAHRLFEGLDWENDNTISFEAFLRGIVQLVQDEFGEVPEEDEQDGSYPASPLRSSAATAPGGVPTTGSTHAPMLGQGRRCVSTRVDKSEPSPVGAGSADTSQEGQDRPRSASATGMVAASPTAAPASTPPAGASGRRRSGTFVAAVKEVFRKGDGDSAASVKEEPAAAVGAGI